jgi:hypothetical protein
VEMMRYIMYNVAITIPPKSTTIASTINRTHHVGFKRNSAVAI